jgi:hypothetical protein
MNPNTKNTNIFGAGAVGERLRMPLLRRWVNRATMPLATRPRPLVKVKPIWGMRPSLASASVSPNDPNGGGAPRTTDVTEEPLMPNAMSPRLHSLPRERATTISVPVPLPRASLPDLPEEAKLKTLLRSVGVLDEWLEDNEGRSEDEVRLRRIKRWREEALEQLRLELKRTPRP